MKPPVTLNNFRTCEDGSIVTLFAVMMAIFFGILALGFDFGRNASTQSELQSYSDNVALAVAGELDGRADAISRATNAAQSLISDTQTFGDGATDLGVDDITLTFYAKRPETGSAAHQTSDPLLANYVSVSVAPRRIAPIFGAVFATLSGQNAGIVDNVSARSVAGNEEYACNITPLLICAPLLGLDVDASIGSTLELDTSLTVGRLDPGTVHLISPTLGDLVDLPGVCEGLSGIGLDLCLISADGPRGSCYSDRGVTFADPDPLLDLNAALNVRMDIFEGAASNLLNNANFPVAPNVLSGFEPADGGQCISGNAQISATTMGLPADDCLTNDTCSFTGNGDWSQGRQAYINANYDGTDPYPNAQTRYDFYLAEIEASANPAPFSGGLGGLLGGLGGLVDDITGDILPSCSSIVSDDPARRVLVTAIVDCNNISVDAGITTAPVLDFAEVFMTAPSGMGGGDSLVVEILGSLGGNPAGDSPESQSRRVIRLYE